MTTDPLASPEAREHLRQTQVLERKLTEYLEELTPEIDMPDESDGRPVLRVMPTRTNDGRVRLTIKQLSALMGLEVDELLDETSTLADLLADLLDD